MAHQGSRMFLILKNRGEIFFNPLIIIIIENHINHKNHGSLIWNHKINQIEVKFKQINGGTLPQIHQSHHPKNINL